MKIAVLFSHDSHKGIVNALRNQEHQVSSYDYGPPLDTKTYKLIFHNCTSHLILEKDFNKTLSRFYNDNKNVNFDIVLIFKGHKINKNSKNILSSLSSRKIQWTTDSLSRWPNQESLFDYMDNIYVQDGDDLKKDMPKMEWLPLGFDDTIFTYNPNKEIDILLIGNLKKPFYETRRSYIWEASKLGNKGYKIAFVGSQLLRHERIFLVNNNVKVFDPLSLVEYAKKISLAKICLNIHQDDGGQAVNPLFFAIPSVGTYQVTEEFAGRKSYLRNWTYGSKLIIESSIEKLNLTLENLLHKYTIPSQETTVIFKEKHSYRQLAKKIIPCLLLAILNLINLP